MPAILQQLLLFAAAALVVTIAPGPDNLSVLGTGLSRGRKPAMAFGLGCALGCLTHTLWAAAGVTVILKTSAIAFTVFKLLGAGYLFYLGVLALRASGDAPIPRDAASQSTSAGRFLARGFIANAINPKVALFFLAFLPQFIRHDGPSPTLQIIALGLLFAAITVVVFDTLGFFSGQIGIWLRTRPTVGRRLDQLTGILFMGLGIRLLLQKR